jgi:hypothetical protein
VLVDADGGATLRTSPESRGAYLLRMSSAPRIERGIPLHATVDVIHLSRDGERFDLLHKKAGHAWRSITVDAARTPPYSRDAYR